VHVTPCCERQKQKLEKCMKCHTLFAYFFASLMQEARKGNGSEQQHQQQQQQRPPWSVPVAVPSMHALIRTFTQPASKLPSSLWGKAPDLLAARDGEGPDTAEVNRLCDLHTPALPARPCPSLGPWQHRTLRVALCSANLHNANNVATEARCELKFVWWQCFPTADPLLPGELKAAWDF